MPNGLSLADFKAALFDVDGTLVNTLPALVRGLGDSYEHFNGVKPTNEQIQATIGLPLTIQMNMFREGKLDANEVQERIDFTISAFERYAHMEEEFDAAIETLQLVVNHGFKTALVTSKSADEISLFAARVPWVGSVGTIICASDVKHPKPDPESALLACERLHVSPSEAIFIGDSIFDMQCAERAGMKRAAVGYGSGNKTALLNEHPDLFFETPEALLEWAKESIFRTPCLEGKQ